MHRAAGTARLGRTQATVLALKALTAYSSTRERGQGRRAQVTLVLNGKSGTRSYQPRRPRAADVYLDWPST
jgi:hypothetical protein